MSLFVWNSVFSVGIDEIDRQHKMLIERMNILYEHSLQNAPRREVVAAMDDLVQCTIDHFTWEEEAMRQAGYKDLAAHITHHQRLLAQVGSINDKIKSGTRELDNTVMEFLKNWLQRHILGIDKRYAATVLAHQEAHPD